jgi:hypothetical protein
MGFLSVVIGVLFSFVLPFFTNNQQHTYAQYGCPPISGGYEPKIIARQNSSDVFVFWNYFYDCGQRVLLFKKSPDHGNTFSNSIVVADSNSAGSAPAIAASSGSNYLYAAWFKYSTQPSPTLLFRKSIDNGLTFGDPVKVDTNGTVQDSILGILTSPTNNNNIGIVWSGILAKNGTDEVFLSKSLDGGESFGQPILLGKSTADYLLVPHIAQVSTKAYVLWSTAGETGEHFVTKINIDDDNGDPFSIGPIVRLGNIGASAIAASGDNVYIVGTTGSTSTTTISGSPEGVASNGIFILLLKSSDGGLNFDKPPTVLASYNNTDSNHVNSLALDASKNFVYVTWYNFHSPQIGAEINARASSDYGNTFGSIQKLSSGTGVSEPVVTTTSGDSYYVSWQNMVFKNNNTSYQRLFIASSSDGGNTFDRQVDLTGNAGISNPGQAMAADNKDDHVYIAWLDYAFKDGNHIMFTKNIDGGRNNFSNAIDLDEDSHAIIMEASSSPEFSSTTILVPIAVAVVIGFTVFSGRRRRR